MGARSIDRTTTLPDSGESDLGLHQKSIPLEQQPGLEGE
jgi:hypothetical protein